MKRTISLTLSLLLLFSLLSLFPSCSAPNGTDASSDASSDAEAANADVIKSVDLAVNGTAVYRIVRGEKAAEYEIDGAKKIFSALRSIAPDVVFSFEDDWVMRGTVPDHDVKEVLIGVTNRPETVLARQLAPKYKDYAVTIQENKIFIYSMSEDSLAEAVDFFISRLTCDESGTVTYTAESDVVKLYDYPQKTLDFCGFPADDFGIVIPAGANSGEDLFADEFSSLIAGLTGNVFPVTDEENCTSPHRILIGTRSGEIPGDNEYCIGAKDGDLVVDANCAGSYLAAFNTLAPLIEAGGIDEGYSRRETANLVVYKGSDDYMSGKYGKALSSVLLTGDPRKDIIAIAESQIGYSEGSNSSMLSGTKNGDGNYTEFGRWYGSQDMWCQIFVSFCAARAGVSVNVIKKDSWTVAALRQFMDQGRAYSRADVAESKYDPQPGDIIYFKSSRNDNITNHVGIVTDYDYKTGTIWTIEGNTHPQEQQSTNGGQVAAKKYNISDTYIVYVCCPAYVTKK